MTTDSTAEPAGELPDEVPGHVVLDRVAAFVARYVAFPDPHCLPAVVLWAAHTWAADAFYTTPRLVLDSAEPGSGKTRVLELLNLFCRDPEMILSPTTAAIFRMLADKPYTLLFDETDAVFNTKNAGNNEDLRALLNAGYKRTATIPRCVGDAKNMRVQRFRVFAPVALAGIAGNMPATILTRAVTIHMRRRGPGETVQPFEEEDAEQAAGPIRDTLAAWTALPATDAAVRVRPELPAGVVDRAAEVWRPLVAFADAAGGDWPEAARDACRAFVLDRGPEAVSLGVRLLSDLRSIFVRLGADRLASTDLVKELTAIEEAPWSDLYGKPLDARRLARELDRYDVRPGPMRVAGSVVKGYQVAGPTGLADAWSRYLPCTSTGPAVQGELLDHEEGAGADPSQAVTAVTAVTSQVRGVTAESGVTDTAVTPARHGAVRQDHVTDATVTPPATVTPLTRQVTDVTDVTGPDRSSAGDLPAGAYGPCLACGRQTHRYGPGGNARCPSCRTADPRNAA